MILKTMTCYLLVEQPLNEKVMLGYKNEPEKLAIRITSFNEDKAKPHQMDVKIKPDNRKEDDGFLIAILPDGRINTNKTLDIIMPKRRNIKYKNICRDFDNYYEYTSGALYYGRHELKTFAKNERSSNNKYIQDVQDKMDEYYKLPKEEQKYYQRKALGKE